MSGTPLNPDGIFDRPLPPGYRDELRTLIAAQLPDEPVHGSGSVLIFQLGKLRLALPARVAAAIAPVLHIARIPHRSGTVLLGLAAFRGELMPCCSLSRILDLVPDQAPDSAPDLRPTLTHPRAESEGATARTLILEQSPGRAWAIPIDGVLGVAPATSEVCLITQAPIDKQWLLGTYNSPAGEFHLLDPDVLFRQIMLATA